MSMRRFLGRVEARAGWGDDGAIIKFEENFGLRPGTRVAVFEIAEEDAVLRTEVDPDGPKGHVG